MPHQAEKNAEIIHHLVATQPEAVASNAQRFILYGSLARGVLLGSDVADLNDPKGRSFKDVDIIDRTGQLHRQYQFLGGIMDGQALKVVRPVETGSTTWGFYDTATPVQDTANPLSTFHEESLGLSLMEFSPALYPGERIPVPSVIAMLALSNFFAYAYEMPKHASQRNALIERAPDYKDSEIWQARDAYIAAMEQRYPLSVYGRARKRFFSFAPSIALSIQKGRAGEVIRFIRGVSVPSDIPLSPHDLTTRMPQN